NAVVAASTRPGFARPHDDQKLETFTRFFNDNFAKCRLEVKEKELVFGEGCNRARGFTNDRGDRLAYQATSKYITITTGYILQLLDEDRIISTFAHELGHFYRSHINMPTDVVNYFYSLDEKHTHKPAPDPRFIEQTAKAREKLRSASYWPDFREENALMRE